MHDSTRVDAGRKCWTLLPIKVKARTVVLYVGGGGEVPAMWPNGWCELRKGGSWTSRAKITDRMKKWKTKEKKATAAVFKVRFLISVRFENPLSSVLSSMPRERLARADVALSCFLPVSISFLPCQPVWAVFLSPNFLFFAENRASIFQHRSSKSAGLNCRRDWKSG